MDNPILRWLLGRPLTQQITLAMLLMFVAAAGSVGFTLYELDLRKHDYVILNLSGQLRALAQGMVRESLHFQEHTDSDTAASIYRKNLSQQAQSFEKIITALQERSLPPELTGREEPLVCSWDNQAIAQLDLTSRTWEEFSKGIAAAMATHADREAMSRVANFILENEGWLTVVAANLTNAFQAMMEGKMGLISRFNQASLVFSLLAVIVLLLMLYFSFIFPLRQTMSGVERIANGEFGFQIPQQGSRELSHMVGRLNLFSRRIHSIFQLTDRISQANTLSETLRFVFNEFRTLLPLDWVGMLVMDGRGERFVLQHRFTEGETKLNEGDSFLAAGTMLGRAMEENRPLHLPDLEQLAEEDENAEFAARLAEDGRRSALFFPLSVEGDWSAMVAFAVSARDAYTPEHLELLGNIEVQVAHGFEKTVVTENLVITAVAGLAKLAESRDLDTGDHLTRMARYSALIAEELGREGPYMDRVNTDLVRDIFRFAPMHDIGKVGIPDSILLKPGKLGSEEWHEMRRHPSIGGEVLRRCEMQMNAVGHSVFQVAIEIAECHHENFNGTGYPSGLTGENIPLSARVVTAADVFDALTSKRPYKEAWSVDQALILFREDEGQQFDPVVVEAMERAMPRIMEVYMELRHV
jgi:HD-GYP domain-containing protein (c-di-GMP phosphodiesterase class II)